MIESKTCPHCNTTYTGEGLEELSEHFGWRRKGFTLASYCKECRKEMNRKRYEEKREEILAKNNEYYHYQKEKYKKYYTSNREEKIATQSKWNKEHSDKRVDYNKKYYTENRETILTNLKLKRAK